MAQRKTEENSDGTPRGGIPAPIIGAAVAAILVIGLIVFLGMRDETPVVQTDPFPEEDAPTEPMAGGENDGAVSMEQEGVRTPEETQERIEGDGLATEAEEGEQLFEGTGEDPDLMEPGENTVNEGEAGPEARPNPPDDDGDD
ncbi:MAG: hypothetical protein ACLFTP_08430 [Rhodosalinus sp.]|uniref:hypothetical protein n=1 Tax=Rhodosalinus sp. TaxID=2047741 RepID=UPI003979898D